jgi:cephalosporin hydroxylase
MKLEIDTDRNEVVAHADGRPEERCPLFSPRGFELLSDLWVKVGWSQKYSYSFTWFGRPQIQLPEDVVRMQEVVWAVKPDLVIETGVAHGGSLVFYASLLKAIGHGRVIGIDIEIRPANRQAIEAHGLSNLISLVEGSSVDPAIVAQVGGQTRPGDRVLVVLDSNHSYEHVSRELAAYSPLVSIGSYIVATDGIISEFPDLPNGKAEWADDNATRAAADFAATYADFVLETPARSFDESRIQRTPTYWPGAWLKRVR